MEEKQTAGSGFPSAFSLFRPSVDALMVNIWTFLGLLLIPMAGLFLAIPLAAAGGDAEVTKVLAIVVGIACFVFLLFVGPAIPYVELKSVQGVEVSLNEALKGGLRHFWRFYGVSLLVGLIVVIGFVLLIIPGVFMLKRYYLAQFYIYDQNMGVMDAMKKCAEDSKAFSGAIWGLIGVYFLIQLPGIVPLFGLVSFVLTILYYCAPAVRYFQIKAASAQAPKQAN